MANRKSFGFFKVKVRDGAAMRRARSAGGISIEVGKIISRKGNLKYGFYQQHRSFGRQVGRATQVSRTDRKTKSNPQTDNGCLGKYSLGGRTSGCCSSIQRRKRTNRNQLFTIPMVGRASLEDEKSCSRPR